MYRVPNEDGSVGDCCYDQQPHCEHNDPKLGFRRKFTVNPTSSQESDVEDNGPCYVIGGNEYNYM